eukprot:11251143-Karenia_brevis.AAC.1
MEQMAKLLLSVKMDVRTLKSAQVWCCQVPADAEPIVVMKEAVGAYINKQKQMRDSGIEMEQIKQQIGTPS